MSKQNINKLIIKLAIENNGEILYPDKQAKDLDNTIHERKDHYLVYCRGNLLGNVPFTQLNGKLGKVKKV